MKKYQLILALAAFTFACSAPKEENESTEEVAEVAPEAVENDIEMASDEDSLHFGRLIDEDGAIMMDDFAAKMEGKDSMELKIMAVAAEVCQKKGCWMKVETSDGSMMRIRFKDYGFFVPKDIAGKQVVFSGMAFRETVSVEDLKHYAEDGGASADEIAAITEPETKISFMADGVMIK